MTRRRPRGFTLLELIVVLGIFGVLSVMAYGGLASVMKSREHIAASLARTTELQKAYLRLREDFQQLRARGVRDEYGETAPALMMTRDGAVEFTRGGWHNPLALPRATLERVAYRVNGDKQLVRSSWRVLDRAQSSLPVDLPVLDKVERVAWRFLDPSLQWHDGWPDTTGTAGGPANLDAAPRAVEITLELTDLGTLRFLFANENAGPAGTTGPGGTTGASGGAPAPETEP